MLAPSLGVFLGAEPCRRLFLPPTPRHLLPTCPASQDAPRGAGGFAGAARRARPLLRLTAGKPCGCRRGAMGTWLWGRRGSARVGDNVGGSRLGQCRVRTALRWGFPLVWRWGLDSSRAVGSSRIFSGWVMARWGLPRGSWTSPRLDRAPFRSLGPDFREMLLLALGFSRQCLKPGRVPGKAGVWVPLSLFLEAWRRRGVGWGLGKGFGHAQTDPSPAAATQQRAGELVQLGKH